MKVLAKLPYFNHKKNIDLNMDWFILKIKNLIAVVFSLNMS